MTTDDIIAEIVRRLSSDTEDIIGYPVKGEDFVLCPNGSSDGEKHCCLQPNHIGFCRFTGKDVATEARLRERERLELITKCRQEYVQEKPVSDKYDVNGQPW